MSCCEPCNKDFDAKIKKNSQNHKMIVCAIIIDEDERILISKRKESQDFANFWEFPGGKINHGEIPELALTRELKEELAIDTCPSCFYPLSFLSHPYDDFHLTMLNFICRKWQGTPISNENQKIKWVKKNDLFHYQFPPANKSLIEIINQAL